MLRGRKEGKPPCFVIGLLLLIIGSLSGMTGMEWTSEEPGCEAACSPWERALAPILKVVEPQQDLWREVLGSPSSGMCRFSYCIFLDTTGRRAYSGERAQMKPFRTSDRSRVVA